MTPLSAALAVLTLAGAALAAWVKWGERRACRFAEVTDEPVEGEVP